MFIIDKIYSSTLSYIENIPKNARKKIGQFFTPPNVARFMGSLMEYKEDSVKILDAGAGSGILTGALCEEILKNDMIKNIYVDLYENNEDILPLLQENMKLINSEMLNFNKNFTYKIKDSNFIIDNTGCWREELGAKPILYDVIISNPPYKKIGKKDLEAIAMQDIVYGQPNIYFLFMAMAAKLLKDDGQMIFINPRSFTSGAYFQKFRQWFFTNVKIAHLHLFLSRGEIFKRDKVLQETIIIKAIKTKKSMNSIMVTESENMNSFDNIEVFNVPYDAVVQSDDNAFMLIPTKDEDIEILRFMGKWHENLLSLGYKLKTGPVVDFRSTEFLIDDGSNNGAVPLFWAYNFEDYHIKFPLKHEKKPQYIMSNEKSRSLLIDNKNYIFVKRFTSKEESRRIQSAIYFADEFNFNLIGIENHLNYITKQEGNMSTEELYGLFVILNSSYIDKYFRILNGSTQVNANEMNSIPFPKLDDIVEMGFTASKIKNLTIEICDRILEERFTIKKFQNVV